MNKFKLLIKRFALLGVVGLLSSCGGGGGGGGDGDTPPPANFIELLDPTPGVSDAFGSHVLILTNGNVVVTDPNDSSIAALNGAVHLYDPPNPNPIASIYGDNANDYFGSHGVTALGNNHFVIASAYDEVSGNVNAGSVRLMDGTTGDEINVLSGDDPNDYLGSSGITTLPNNNFVIASPNDDENTFTNAGSVRLVNGTSGLQIGVLVGNKNNDQLGLTSVTALGNNNFVIASQFDDENTVINSGSVRLVDGSTAGSAAQIGPTLAGDMDNDYLGRDGITALANNNFVIVSLADDVGGIVDAGSVRLVNGTTGLQIGALAGDIDNDFLGNKGITALNNNHFVVASISDDEGGIVNAGSVRLVNATTGLQIGITLKGNTLNDQYGSGGVTALANNNFVVASPFYDGSFIDGGAVTLDKRGTGGSVDTLQGNTASDFYGSGGITALANNNYVIASPVDDVSLTDNGSVRLMNGTTGALIGSALEGDLDFDRLGLQGVTALANSNYVIVSMFDDEGGFFDAGSVRLVNGSTGAQIGGTIAGDEDYNLLGIDGVTALPNNNFVIATQNGTVNGVVDAGSVQLVNGTTGVQIGDTLAGETTGDGYNLSITTSANNDDVHILSLPLYDNDAGLNSGRVYLVTQAMWFDDTDGDGFGDPKLSSVTQPSAAWVRDHTDCDVGDATINPSATEVQDDVDNNCDGVIDEGFTKIVFVTSAVRPGDLDWDGDSGLVGADALCAEEATAGGLPGTYKAWVSTSTVDAIDRVTRGVSNTYTYLLSDRITVIANGTNNTDGLTSGTLQNPIDRAAANYEITGTNFVWTGTTAAGINEGSTCSDWTDNISGTGRAGLANTKDSNWTSSNSLNCGNGYRLYCFQE